MTSGQLGQGYSTQVLEFGWKEFFETGGGGEFLERLRRQWREEYEFTLIDSRTGITDSGGICTIMLPDMIVPVLVSNYQSIEGTVEVIARAQAARKNLAFDRPPAAILPILSRFESRAEYETAQEWLDFSAERVKPFYNDWLPTGFNPRRALERTKLPYVTFFSFGEKLPALIDSTSDPESLGYALNVVSLLIEQKLENAELILSGATEEITESPSRNTPHDDVEEPAARERAARLFLSYSEEDGEVARQIARSFREYNFEVFTSQEQRDGAYIKRIEEELQRATAFVVLLSPQYLASPWSRMERELAIQRELDLQAADSDFLFIHVLQVADTPYANSGFLRRYDWYDLTDQGNTDQMLDALVGRIEPRNSGPTYSFRDRHEELDRVLNGLTNAGGPHFWVIVAPPQLGKTWFLDRLSAQITDAGQGFTQWVTRLIDLREQPLERRGDANALLAQLFGPLIGDQHAVPRNIARGISRDRKSYLCLLDSAELLTEETVKMLRTQLSSIYRYVQEAGNSDVRLALVVATRREQGWRGVAPYPRLSVLSMTEFSVETVLQALRGLAAATGRTFSDAYLQRNAERVHSLSEGLPALLAPCIRWIQEEEWLETDRLETEELFAEIAHPYVQERLLSPDSLYPEANERPHRWGQRSPGEPLYAVTKALRLLVPYRLFTQSHLRHHMEADSDFAETVDGLQWSVEDIWGAISGSSLLLRPLDEPWQEIYPAIRRLLYRYFYQTAEAQALAHHEARKFVEVWADSQTGREQVVGLLESLWHEAYELRLSRAADMEERLSDSARKLSLALRESSAYTITELRAFAAKRMRDDEEFQQAVDNIDGLFDRLTSIILVQSTE